MIYLNFWVLCLCFIFIKLSLAEDPVIISRNEWNALPAKKTTKLKVIPPEYVVIHHSADLTCDNLDQCKRFVKQIQKFHMVNQKWYDIGYNFLVGGDGNVYEGRGWDIHGAHLPELNSNSIGICLLGNFDTSVPTAKQLQATKDLIEYALNNNHISSDYKLIGHKQKISTQCPGNNLYSEIVNWPHWTNN